MRARLLSPLAAIAIAAALAPWTAGIAASPDAVTSEGGKYFDADGEPTFHIDADGTVDWFTFSGFRRYHSECHVCHGPDAMGSSFAPALLESMQTLTYADYMEVVVNGRENVSVASHKKMPAFGLNRNVMCYVDDIYVYLRARAADAIGRGRPAKKQAKTEEARADEESCMAN